MKDYLTGRLETALIVIEEGIQVTSLIPYENENQLLMHMREEAARLLREIVYNYNDCTIPAVAVAPYKLSLHTGSIGRPRLLIKIEHVELLQSVGFTWQEIADAVQVSRTTLWRRLREEGVATSRYSGISEDDLDVISEEFNRIIQIVGRSWSIHFCNSKEYMYSDTDFDKASVE